MKRLFMSKRAAVVAFTRFRELVFVFGDAVSDNQQVHDDWIVLPH